MEKRTSLQNPEADAPGFNSSDSDDLEHSMEANQISSSVGLDGPPDGGYLAWLHAVLMHLVFFNTWGLANGFGIFQQYYSSTLGESQSSISWIGTVQVFLLFLVGVAAGRLTDAGYFRAVFAVGVVLQLCGIFLTSLCTTYWQIFLAQAVAVGLGNGCTFCPALSILSSYFHKNRALAVGIAAAGAGTGGLVYPVIVNQLIHRAGYGFPWALRIMGFVMLATSLPCLIWFTPRVPPRRTGPLIDKSAFRELPFVFFSLSMFLNFWGLYFVFFYLGTFARDHIGIAQPVNLIMILNGVGIVGRIVPGIVAARWTGSLNLLIPLSFTTALLVYCWAAIHTEGALIAFAVVYGLFAAALQSLFPAVATTMTPDINRTGTRVGMIFSIVSFATLTGPAISGALIQKGQGSYLGAQIFAGTCIFLGACAAAAARASTKSTQPRISK